MKRSLLTTLAVAGALAPGHAGGVFYNSNKSAEYFRTFDRNSAIDNADIVYYNMAGTVRLGEGWTCNLSNQTLFQRATVSTVGNPVVGDKTYTSSNPAWVVPNVYGAYRKGNWSAFLGFEAIGATAIREWENGLPTLDLVAKQMAGYGSAASGVIAGDAYTQTLLGGGTLAQAQAAAVAAGLDARYFTGSSNLKGSSYYLAFRHGAAWQVNPKWSVALAGRLVVASQSIVGRLDGACTYQNATFNHDLRTTATALIDTTSKATGYSGELGVNFYPTEAWVLSFTYEQATRLNFKTSVRDGKDGAGSFVDGSQARLDLPQVIRFGAGYQATPKVRVSAGLNAYLEGQTDFSLLDNATTGADHRKDYGNTLEESLAVEVRLNPKWLVSAGVNFNQLGQKKASTMDTSLPGAHAHYWSLGTGVQYAASERLKLNLGLGWTQFTSSYENADSGDRQVAAAFAAQGVSITPRKAYDKRYFIVAIGVNYRF